MADNNLILILKTMNKKEFKDLGLFIDSPFFNTNKNVLKLYELIRQHGDTINSGKIDLRYFHKKIYRNKPFKEENMKTLVHLLTRIANKYLSYTEFIKSPGEEKLKLMRAYDKRNIEKLYKKLEISEGEELSKIRSMNLNILYRKMWYEKSKIDYYSTRAIEKELHQAEIKLSEITIAIFFVEMFRQFNMFWRLDYIDYEIEREFVIPVMKSIDIEKINNFMAEGAYKYYPLFEAYYYLYRSIDDDEEKAKSYLEKFKEILKNKNSQIEKSEQFVLSTIMVNFIHYLYIKDFAKHERSLFDAFKILLSLYKYSGEKHLRLTIYTNMLRFGIQLNEYEWSKEFILNFSPMLEENQRENMYNYGWCFLSFALKDYEKALEFESTMQMKYYMRDVRLCSLYELGEYEIALNLIDSYRHFIKEEKNFKSEMKKGYKEFVEHANDLIKLKLGNGKIYPDLFIKKINNSVTMRKAWLLAKARELL
jgi:hypothetical protein